MHYLNILVGALVDALMRFCGRPWPALVAAAAITAVLMLLIVRASASPVAIRRAKNRLTARVLELVLFRHDASVSFTALGRILAANLSYLKGLLVPIAFSIVPCALILAQLACWFDFRPLSFGEAALLEVKLRDGSPVGSDRVSLARLKGARADTEGLRLPAQSEVDWRLRAERTEPGFVEIALEGESPLRKELALGDAFQKISRRRTASNLGQQFLNPGEAPIDPSSSVEWIDIRYPRRQLELGSWEIDWLVAFLALAIAFGLVLRRPLRVPL